MRLFRSLFFLLILFSAGFVSAQNRFAENQIQLKSGTYNCPENVAAFIVTPYAQEEIRNGYYTRIVQFTQLPSKSLRQEMASNGFSLKSYIPNKAYLVIISEDFNGSLLNDWNARSVIKLEPRFKLSPQLANQDFPEHSLRAESIVLEVQYAEELLTDQLFKDIEFLGGIILKKESVNNVLEIQVPLSQLYALSSMPELIYINAISPEPVTENFRARTDHRVNFYQNGGEQLGGYDGTGIVIGLGDGGQMGSHIDFEGRFDNVYNGNGVSDHSTHVAGSILGAGNLDPNGKGASPGATIYSYVFGDAIDSSASHYIAHNVRITNNSWGSGNTPSSCAGYTSGAQFTDETIYENPSLMHVFSSGNNGTGFCGYGSVTGWGNITGGNKQAKNGIVVGNVTYQDLLASSSSRGPAEDGRLKPDVVGVGSSVYSTYPSNTYSFSTGTSMSTPGVSGMLATMMHAYKENNSGQEPTSALMKGIMLNTADDLGNAGPDFRYGYGRVNARKAINSIENQTYFEDSVATGDLDTFNLTVPGGIGVLKILLYWNDKEGNPFALNPLVNNLNLQVTDPSGTTYDPWILDNTANTAALNSPATRGVDNINNTEQVTLTNPAAGNYTISVSGVSVGFGPQEYALVYHYELNDEIVVVYPNGGDAIRTPSTEVIRWDAISNGSPFTVDYSIDNGANWVNIGTAGSNVRYSNWTPGSSINSDELLVRVSRGSAADQSDSVSAIYGVPGNLQVQSVCPDSIAFSWNSVTGATEYEIMRMNSNHMEPVGVFTGTTGAVLNHDFSRDYYYSIRAVGPNGGRGERDVALLVPAGLVNCQIDTDVELSVASPIAGPNPGCGASIGQDVIVRLTNQAVNDIYGASLSYQYGSSAVVTESITDTIVSGSFIDYTFTQNIPALSSTPTDFIAYHSVTSDQNNYNDTIKQSVFSYSGTVSMTPWADNLESFSACGTTANCANEVCTLPGGWLNLTNGVHDDIDWRTNFGGTPSTGTGPSQDFNPGTGLGKYLYLEASGCFGQMATVHSPCVDIPATGSTELTYRYHMNGAQMGMLQTDVIANGRLYENVIPPISGNQGNSWNLASINLSPYAGQTVVIRLRGITGPDFTSDIAIDDFSIQAPSAAPIAGFISNASSICQGETVDFTSTSTGAPSTFLWGISPSTGWSYVNGTSATSANISVLFSSNGVYSVGLKADNGVGSDSTATGMTVSVGGIPLPFFEDFETATSLDRFTITNPDLDITWERSNASGNGGNNAARIDNYNYSAAENVEVEDWMTTPLLTMNGQTNVHLTFDHAYARYSPTLHDSLAVWISDDCGSTWARILSLSGIGPNGLATVSDQTSAFTPSQNGDWCGTNPACTDIDLSAYSASTNIQIRFVAKSGYGNNLYIDNINIGQPLPAAVITAPVTSGCTGDVFTFSDGSGGAFANYNWDFGSNANPTTATGPGPHQVTYSAGGNSTVVLNADNGGTSASASTAISVNAINAQFSTSSPSAGLINFNPAIQQSNVDSVAWNFGDGNTSDVFSPSHQYASNGTYSAELTAYNECGSDVFSLNVLVQGIGLDELDDQSMKLYPQPTLHNSTIQYFGSDLIGDVLINVVDASGRLIRAYETNSDELANGFEMNLNGLAAGWYQVQITNDSYFWQSPLIKQ